MNFQEARTTNRDGKVHITFSGDKTPCDLTVIEAKPTCDSTADSVTCHTCGAHVTFDMSALNDAAQQHVGGRMGTANWEAASRADFAQSVTWQVAELAFELRREKPGSNRIFSEYMARGGWMTDKSAEARLIGTTALAVIDALVAKG